MKASLTVNNRKSEDMPPEDYAGAAPRILFVQVTNPMEAWKVLRERSLNSKSDRAAGLGSTLEVPARLAPWNPFLYSALPHIRSGILKSSSCKVDHCVDLCYRKSSCHNKHRVQAGSRNSFQRNSSG